MVLATCNKRRKLLFLNYVGNVVPAELEGLRHEIEKFLADLPPDFSLLADLSQVESMDPECAGEIGKTMDVLAKHGVGLILRVIPHPSKDIGLSILTVFHYPRPPRIINCRTLGEALKKLEQWS
jgi:anti-anti-sigma regulatory factor